MKKILFITDNIWIYNKIRIYLDEIGLKDLVDFRCSPNRSPLNNNLLPISVIHETEYILNNYFIVFSAHCLQFFPQKLVDKVKCINIHPGYNPINRGWYPQVFSIIYDLPIGATIHEMDNKLDNGPIIARELVTKFSYDTSEDIYLRVQEIEIKLFKQYFKKIIENNYDTFLPEESYNYFSKADFENMCHLDLNEILTLKSAINKLRALTHGEYKNAFFIDEYSGKKVFVTIKFKVEN